MMKITVIHGQSHEGSTCMVARELANKVGGEIREFSCLGILTGHALAVIPVSKMTYPTARIIKNWSPLLRRFLTVIC